MKEAGKRDWRFPRRDIASFVKAVLESLEDRHDQGITRQHVSLPVTSQNDGEIYVGSS